MSEYSDLLKKYIYEKNVKVADMIQFCNLERSNTYKFINGKRRPPSMEGVRKIANFLQLSPQECEEYYEAYYASICGEHVYEQNKCIQSLIHNFKQFRQRQIYYKKPVKQEIEPVDNSPLHLLVGKNEINYHLKMILEEEILEKQPEVSLITQCENDYLQEMLITLGKSSKEIKIRHLICFQRQGSQSEQNLNLIQRILEIYASGCRYEPYYYYDEVNAHFYNMNLFCNYVICGKSVCCYTSDYSYGQLICEPECVKALMDLFYRYQKRTYPLFERVDSIIQEYLLLGKKVLEGAGTRAYSLHAEPCGVPFITDELLEKHLRRGLPEREKMLQVFSGYIKKERLAVEEGRFQCYFTLEGVKAFLKKGRLGEIPDDCYEPFTEEECLDMIRDMLPEFAKGNYRLLKNHMAEIPNDLHIFVASATGHFLFLDNHKKLVYITMNESGMISQFYHFMEGMNEELDLCTAEEAITKIRQLLETNQNNTTDENPIDRTGL